MESDIKEFKRDTKEKDQMGRGLKKLYGKVKDCDDYNLQNVIMGLSENDINRICVCVSEYLSGHIELEDEYIRKIVEEDKYMNMDLFGVANNRYSFEKKKKFLCNDPGYRGYNVAKVACHFLMPHVISLINKRKKENIEEILRLKRKIKKLRKGEDHEESGSDEDDVDDGEGDEQSDDVDSDEEGEERGNDEDKVAKEGEQSESEETEAEED